MNPRISIVCPAIRVDNWQGVYDSICGSTSIPFELILISPYDLPVSLKGRNNVKHIVDWGNPVRCSNIGLQHCDGELITVTADDGQFLPDMLDKAIESFDAMPPHPKNVLVAKYYEHDWTLQPESYYLLNLAYPRTPNTYDDWLIFNLVITKTAYLKQLGGWDARFETPAFAHADMAIRAQRDDCITKLYGNPLIFCQHGQPDHGPIERGHVDHDDPLYRSIHNDPNDIGRINIDINNWQQAPARWTRRFGE